MIAVVKTQTMNFSEVLKSILSLFTEQLAVLFDKLRLASPVAYLIVTALVVAGAEIVKSNPDLIANLPDWTEYVIVIIEVTVPILLSARTKRHIRSEQAKVQALGVDMRDFDD